jgi:beta-mannosidase
VLETYLATGWEFQHKGAWLQARVPGCVHDDLLRHGAIADPFFRMDERECKWVDDCDWVYRCRFDWSAKEGCPKRVLRFEGLDTVCDVFLNGERIAQNDNMFLPLEVDVTALLRPQNELRIEFASAVRVANERRSRYLAQEGIDPSLTTFYERSFVRKAQYMFGWDWGPRLVSCGIWKPVSLIEYESRVTDVCVRPRSVEGEWLVDVSWEGERVGTPKLEICRASEDHSFEIDDVGATIALKSPRLWCPSDMGQPHLYTMKLDFGGQVRHQRFGCRTVELVRKPDDWGESFEFVVNGNRVFCRGANWIPDHSFPALAVSRMDYGLSALQWNLHCHMLRVWGGGLYERDDFYECCDTHGIMVWQDFPFACAYYPEDEAFVGSVEAEARANIRRLRNHPSLVLWCGNNECQQMHEQKWGGNMSPERFHGEKIFDDLLPRILREEDPDRHYVHGSPSGKVEGRDCNMDGVGDSHYWEVWHGKGDWRHYEESTSRFCSEFGFASSPSLHTWSKTLDREADWAFDSEAVKWHDKTLKGYEKYISFIELHYPKVETLEDLVYYSQLNQRDAMRCAIEHYLRSESCRGTLVWQANDCWPAQSWSLLDSGGRVKPASDEVARLYQAVAASIKVKNQRAEFWVSNNGYEPFDVAKLGIAGLFSVTGEQVVHLELEPRWVEPATASLIGTLDLDGRDPRGHFALIALTELDPCVRLFVEPKEFLPRRERIVAHVCRTQMLRVSCNAPVLDLWMYDPDDLANVHSHKSEMIGLLMPGWPPVRFLRFNREPKRLVARSLAGYHEVEITRSPL